jgi:hypothetical protein
MLRRDERTIWLEIPWLKGLDYHRAWFPEVGLDGDAALPLPEELVFEDSQGPVVLSGLQVWGSSENLMSDVGTGRLRVDYAVPGTRALGGHQRPHGLMSSIDGLGRFSGERAVSVEYARDRSSSTILTLQLAGMDARPLCEERGLSLVRGFRHLPTAFDVHEIAGTASIKTLHEAPTPMAVHLRTHRAVQALLGIAFGRPAGFTNHVISLDPHEGAADTRAREWHELLTHKTGIGDHEPLPDDGLPLFTLQEIGPDGVARWLRMWDEWPRAMLPLAAMVRMRSHLLEAQFVTLGIGLEALGYYLAVAAGKSSNRADDLDLDKKLKRILTDAPFSEAVVGRDWHTRTRDLYVQLKHPTHDYPDMYEAFELLNASVTLFRLWVAMKLGVQIDDTRIARA